MTREETITLIKSAQLMLINPTTNEPISDLYTALEMAISALEQITQIRKAIVEAEEENLHLSYPVWCFMRKIEKIVGEKKMGEFEQEPCDDDGVDHEKIRKAFTKESDIKKADIADMIQKVIMQAEEETDRFIFKTIRPYCEEITQQEISKEILSKALTQYFSKPTECDDAISREDVEECKELMTDINRDTVYAVRMSDIRQLPSVTQKSGKWIYRRGDKYSCSKCGTTTSVDESGIDEKPMYKFCPYCGARMFEPQESEEQTE